MLTLKKKKLLIFFYVLWLPTKCKENGGLQIRRNQCHWEESRIIAKEKARVSKYLLTNCYALGILVDMRNVKQNELWPLLSVNLQYHSQTHRIVLQFFLLFSVPRAQHTWSFSTYHSTVWNVILPIFHITKLRLKKTTTMTPGPHQLVRGRAGSKPRTMIPKLISLIIMI